MNSSLKNRGKTGIICEDMSMNNLLVGDPQVEVIEVVEGLLDASDMPGTLLNGFLVKK